MQKTQEAKNNEPRALRSAVAYCLIGVLLFSVGCASPEVTAARSGLSAESQGSAPPLTTNPGGQSWRTHSGVDTGPSDGSMMVTRLGLYYFPLNRTFVTTKTSNGFTVGRDGKFAYIIHPSPNNSPGSIEIYGTTLKSIRMFRGAETNRISAGADIIYITRDGVFKASELKD